MKFALAITAILLATTAQARDPTSTEAAYIMLTSTADEEDSATHDFLQSNGVTIVNLPALKSYARKSIKEMDEWSAKWDADLCKDRAKYEGHSEKLAQRFDKGEDGTSGRGRANRIANRGRHRVRCAGLIVR